MKGLIRQLRPIITYARIDVKKLFRDKVAIFFTIVFPLIFLFVFGGLFGNDSNVSFKVALQNNSSSDIAKQVEQSVRNSALFEVDASISSKEQATEKMSQGVLDASITIPEGFGDVDSSGLPGGTLEVFFDQSNATGAQTLASVLDGVIQELNASVVPVKQPFGVSVEASSEKGLTQFDYTFSGLLGFAILSLGIFGPTSAYPRLKQRGVLRRYRTTPIKVWQYFLANVVSNSVYGLISVGAMFAAAMVFFDLNVKGNILAIIAFILLSTIVLFGIGLAVGGWAKNENQAAPLANLLAFPMMFLSGSFFPRFLMPDWLQKISDFLPLTPVIDGARLLVTEGKTLVDIAPQIGLLAVWGVIVYLIAFRVFRWE